MGAAASGGKRFFGEAIACAAARRIALPMKFLLLLISPALLHAEDWPHWRGPNHTGVSAEKDFKSDWPVDGPPVLWKAQVGTGFASFSVANARVYTTGFAREQDTVFCLDAVTGKEIWKHSYPSATRS